MTKDESISLIENSLPFECRIKAELEMARKVLSHLYHFMSQDELENFAQFVADEEAY